MCLISSFFKYSRKWPLEMQWITEIKVVIITILMPSKQLQNALGATYHPDVNLMISILLVL